MTYPREQIIAWAREAGFQEPNLHDGYMGLAYDYRDGTDTGASLTHLAALIEQATIERCAKVCEKLKAPDERHSMWAIGTHDCAAAIRALKKEQA